LAKPGSLPNGADIVWNIHGRTILYNQNRLVNIKYVQKEHIMKKLAREYMKETRKAYGWTQEEVCSWVGMKQSLYSKKERGAVELFADEWITIVKELESHGPKPKRRKLPPFLRLVSE